MQDRVSQDIEDSGTGVAFAAVMPKARLVITAITVEKRPVSEVARSYGVARSWICTLLARFEAEGDAAFEPRRVGLVQRFLRVDQVDAP